MTGERILIDGKPGQNLGYAIQRGDDGVFYAPSEDAWLRPVGAVAYDGMKEADPGRYEARLPVLEPGREYCVHVVDLATGQLLGSHLIDGHGTAITAPGTRPARVVPGQHRTTPAPDLGEIAAGIRHLAVYWAGRAWAGIRTRDLVIGVACVLAAFLLWPRGPGREDAEKARAIAEQRAIREVIAQDKALGQQLAQRVGFMDKYWDGSSLVAEFAGRMDSIELGGCPRDFQLAYKRHVAAWRAMASVKASNEGFSGALKGFFTAGLAMIPAMSEMEQVMKEVHASWAAVQQAAIHHGVAP